jgi:hypothetical protein
MPKDSAGTRIEVGQKVAYNCSGNVVGGEVVDVHPGHTKIKATGGATYPRAGHISRVKNSRSILVLAQPPGQHDAWMLNLP